MKSHQCGISSLGLPHVSSRENLQCWRREMLANFSQALPEPRFHCGEKWQKSGRNGIKIRRAKQAER